MAFSEKFEELRPLPVSPRNGPSLFGGDEIEHGVEHGERQLSADCQRCASQQEIREMFDGFVVGKVCNLAA